MFTLALQSLKPLSNSCECIFLPIGTAPVRSVYFHTSAMLLHCTSETAAVSINFLSMQRIILKSSTEYFTKYSIRGFHALFFVQPGETLLLFLLNSSNVSLGNKQGEVID